MQASHVAIAAEASVVIPRLLAASAPPSHAKAPRQVVAASATRGAAEILSLFFKKYRVDLLALMKAAASIDIDAGSA